MSDVKPDEIERYWAWQIPDDVAKHAQVIFAADHYRVVAALTAERDAAHKLNGDFVANQLGKRVEMLALTERLREARELLQVAHRVCTEDDPGDAARMMIDAWLQRETAPGVDT